MSAALGFLGFPRGGAAALRAGDLAVIGAAWGDCADGPDALRRAAAAALAPWSAAQDGVALEPERGAALRFAAPAGLDLGDAADASACKALIEAAHRAGAVPVLLGGPVDAAAPLAAASRGEDVAVLVAARPVDLDTGAARRLWLGASGLQPAQAWAVWPPPVTAATLDAGAVPPPTAERVFLVIDAAALDAGVAAGSPSPAVGGVGAGGLLGLADALASGAPMAGLALTGCAPRRDLRGHAEALLVEACLRLLRPRLFEALA